MKAKQIVRLLLSMTVFFASYSVMTASETPVVEYGKSVPLSDFLESLSKKHEVFFTYNPNLVSKTRLNPRKFNDNNLERTCHHV